MRRYIYLILVAFSSLVLSCVYPFEPNGDVQTSGIVVIEGDILLGNESLFRITTSVELNEPKLNTRLVESVVTVESSTGEVLSGELYSPSGDLLNGNDACYKVDTRFLDPSKQYRVHVVINNSKKNYYSEWLTPEITPEITDLNYEIDNDANRLRFYISTEGNEEQKYYKWTYQEDWEYHTYTLGLTEYDPFNNRMTEIFGIRNWYYCWNKDRSEDIMIASTATLSQNKLVDHEIYSLARSDNKLSFLYATEVIQQTISYQAYIYWNTLAQNTDNVGGLFSPQPSELRGNLYCEEDENEVVLGYIVCSTVSKRRIFFDNVQEKFWNEKVVCESPIALAKSNWSRYYKLGYDVAWSEDFGGVVTYYWMKKECVDCRMAGGNKNKPQWWPNNHD